MDNSEENKEFKVLDKRRFSESGESKDVSTDETYKKETLTLSDKKLADKKLADKDSKKSKLNETPKLDFPSFLVGIYSQTLIFLGEIPNPETNLTSKNIEAAKQNIDILGILEDKTKNNLSEEEDKLMQEILNNLRLLFVKRV